MTRELRMLLTLIVITAALAGTTAAFARVELVVVPQRENVRIKLGGPNTGVGEGIATVQEERVIALDKGRNRLDLAWVGAAIDPASLRLESTEGAGLEVVALSFPPGSANTVRWDVEAAKAGQYRLRISYTLRGLNWTREYTLVANEDETRASLVGLAKIFNRSGEDFTDALIDLGFGEPVRRSFMNGESIELPILSATDVPIEKTFVYDPAKYETDQVVMHYVIKNDVKSKLGKEPLPRGAARIFISKGGSRTFVGEDWLAYTPVGKETKLYVGSARDITVKRTQQMRKQTNIRRDIRDRVVLYDLEEIYQFEVKNHRNKPAKVKIVDHVEGYWEMLEAQIEYKKTDATTIEFAPELQPQQESKFIYHVVGRNLSR